MTLCPARDEALLALGCGLWAACFLVGEGAAALATAPLLTLAVLPYKRSPLVAGLTVPAVVLLHLGLGVPSENPASLAASVVVVYALGRRASGKAVAVPLLANVLAPWALDDFGAATGPFLVVQVGVAWTVGWLVRRRTDGARRAAATAADLSTRDPSLAAQVVVAEERARLAGAALQTVRDAVTAMQRHARAAESDLDPGALDAIGAEGRSAVTELRRLLGLLRSVPRANPNAEPRRRPPWQIDLVTSAAVALGGLGAASLLSPEPSTGSVALSLAFAAPLALRRTRPGAACLLATAVVALGLALDTGLVFSTSDPIVYGLLTWSVASHSRLPGYPALALLAATVLTSVAVHDEPGNEPIVIVVFVVAAITGHLWGARDREGRTATRTAESLRAEHDAVIEAAVRAERLRLARELHDVASHAVGVMVLQAGAAAALRDRDPGRARDAVRAVQTAGVEAMTELDVLFGLLDDGAVGPAGLAGPPGHADLAEALGQLAARIRDAGLDVRLTVPNDLPADEVRLATAYRTVQEALTNAVRHAPGSRVTVTVSQHPAGLHIEVCDDGPGSPPGDPGFGLVGLAERVRSLGGELVVGPRPEGGFGVLAVLPARAGARP